MWVSKKKIGIVFLALFMAIGVRAQHFPQVDPRHYVSDSALFIPKRPWLAAGRWV